MWADQTNVLRFLWLRWNGAAMQLQAAVQQLSKVRIFSNSAVVVRNIVVSFFFSSSFFPKNHLLHHAFVLAISLDLLTSLARITAVHSPAVSLLLVLLAPWHWCFPFLDNISTKTSCFSSQFLLESQRIAFTGIDLHKSNRGRSASCCWAVPSLSLPSGVSECKRWTLWWPGKPAIWDAWRHLL